MAGQPPAHFHRNPPGRGQLAVFPRCSLDPYDSDMGLRSRLEKQPTDLRQNTCYFGDRTLHCAWQAVISWRIRINVPNSSKRLSCLSNLEGAAEHATFKVGRSSGVAEWDGCRRSGLALRKKIRSPRRQSGTLCLRTGKAGRFTYKKRGRFAYKTFSLRIRR